MSEVKRELFEAANPVPFGVFWSEPDSRYMTSMVHLNCIEYNGKWLGWNSAQSELAALREELAKMTDNFNIVVRQKSEFSKRLTAAEQRNADLVEVLKMARFHVSMEGTQDECDRIEAALKPTKSGASE